MNIFLIVILQIDIREAKDVLLEKMMKKLTEEEYKRLEREEICRELYIAEKEQQLKKEAITVALKKKQTAKEFLQEMVKIYYIIVHRCHFDCLLLRSE